MIFTVERNPSFGMIPDVWCATSEAWITKAVVTNHCKFTDTPRGVFWIYVYGTVLSNHVTSF